MGNSFKLIKVIIIIAVILILITMGMFVFKNTNFFVKSNSDKLDITEYSEFNGIWESYKGKQDGAKLKSMAERLVSNAKKNEKDATMLPDLYYQASDGAEPVNVRSTIKGREKNNIEGFNEFKESLNSRHTYFVKFVYSEKTNLISGIIVQYEQKDNLEFVPDET